MSDKGRDRDLRHKLLGKRLAWRMGFIPLVNVALRPPGAGSQVVTDADLLGWRFNPDGSVSTFLADCRDTLSNAVERVLWVRGLSAFVGADQTMLLKKKVPDNARWMADRLNVSWVDDSTSSRVESVYRLSELKGPYFDESGCIACDLTARSYAKGSDYRRIAMFLTFDLLKLRPFERLVSLLEVFSSHQISRTMSAQDPGHRVLVWHACVWFALSLGHVLSSVGAADAASFEDAMRFALAGGRERFEERDRFARRLLTLQRHEEPSSGSPLDLQIFPDLVERCIRFVTRRSSFNEAVRQLDVARHYVAVDKPVPNQVGGEGDEVELGRKYSRDLMDLFLKANILDPAFSTPISLPQTGVAHEPRPEIER